MDFVIVMRFPPNTLLCPFQRENLGATPYGGKGGKKGTKGGKGGRKGGALGNFIGYC